VIGERPPEGRDAHGVVRAVGGVKTNSTVVLEEAELADILRKNQKINHFCCEPSLEFHTHFLDFVHADSGGISARSNDILTVWGNAQALGGCWKFEILNELHPTTVVVFFAELPALFFREPLRDGFACGGEGGKEGGKER